MPAGDLRVSEIENRVIAKVAELSAPLIGKLPTAKEEHRKVILLLGLGCTQVQAAALSGYSIQRIEQLAAIYKRHIKAVSLERDMCVVGVIDQAIGMTGERLNEALEKVDLSKPNTADIMRLANSIESLRRTAYDLRSTSLHGDKPGKQVARPTAITLESLDAAMQKAKRLKEGDKNASTEGKKEREPEYLGVDALRETAGSGDSDSNGRGGDESSDGKAQGSSEDGATHGEAQVTAIDTDGQNEEREVEEKS